MDNKERSRSWFCVWNNPQETFVDLTEDPAAMADYVLDIWIGDSNTHGQALLLTVYRQRD